MASKHRWLIGAGIATLATAAPAYETITYTYDARGRLVSVQHSGTVNNGVSASYGYDPADNRTNVTVSTGGGGGLTAKGAAELPAAQSVVERSSTEGRQAQPACTGNCE